MLIKEVIRGCPFYDEKKERIVTKFRALGTNAFIWQLPTVEKVGSIYVPEYWKADFQSPVGFVLAISEEYWYNGNKYKTDVKVGDCVLFDGSTLRVNKFRSPKDDKNHTLRSLTIFDIWALIDEKSKLEDVIKIKRTYQSIKTPTGMI